MPTSLLAPVLFALLAPSVCAQLNLTFVQSFVDTFPGGTGNIGLTQDEASFDYYIVAFQNQQTVHTFDVLGAPLVTFTSTGCTPQQTTPNDITYDPFADTLWLVDNDGNDVLQMSRQGACLGGFPIGVAITNPVGICFDRNTGTLFISHQGAVLQYDRTGTLLSGGFTFAPPTGSQILSGITYVPATDHFLITQSSGNRVFEVDRTGALVSTTMLSSHGVGNTQGLHYNPVLQRLTVIDNTQSTAYVFLLSYCLGTVLHRGEGCVDGGGQRLAVGATGCADLGTTLTLQALATPSALPLLFAGGTSNTMAGTVPLPLDLSLLGAPSGCWLYSSAEAIIGVGMVGNTATLPFAIPGALTLAGARLFLQVAKLDPSLPASLPLATSNYLDVTVY
jgi:hypothetical protein